ncbi:MAG: YchF/TatD family DNA exonuclease [Candidatus Omnitrophica bacterium]|nr:YchF/TatD family DNA exonuclease [Candidatus Omnitrophota bacterium]
MQLVDTHCHLDMKDYREDIDDVVARASESGVVRIIVPGISYESSKRAIELSERFDNVYSGVGIHPHEADKAEGRWFEDLLSLAGSSVKVVAIGETGLDNYRGISSMDKQRPLFEGSIRLARAKQLPLIIHSRNADKEILEILREESKGGVKGVIHCFSGDESFLRGILDLGLYISFAGNVTFQKAGTLRDIAKKVPPEKLLLETDGPYMAPEPERGKRSEPSHVRYLVELYKDIYGLTAGDIARITTHNANQLFGLGLGESSKIAYSIRNSLYLNITYRCTNSCTFCARDSSKYVKGHDLDIKKEPLEGEILNAMGDVSGYDEIVFCGLGEPTLRMDVVKGIGTYLRNKGKKVRLNTNGEGDLINNRDIAPLLKECVDSVSVSLNAPDAELYDDICKPVYGKQAYNSVILFIRRCKENGIKVEVTCLDLIGEENVRKCREIAAQMGVLFRLRKYNEVG